jgi:hypothetical protein
MLRIETSAETTSFCPPTTPVCNEPSRLSTNCPSLAKEGSLNIIQDRKNEQFIVYLQ